MKNFLRMIEVIKQQKEIKVLGMNQGSFESDFISKPEYFFDIVKECQPFVFSHTGETLDIEEDKENLDAPFKVFSVENINGYVSIPRPEDVYKIYVSCVLACEIHPKKYVYFILTKVNDQESVFLINSDSITAMVDHYIQRMNKEYVGTENIREKIKIGSGKNKEFHTFRKIIHIRPKTDKITVNPETNKTIDWQQRWFVRGHWRKIKETKIGKDRSGNYCIKGSTWVTEHEKGPEDKPLLNKIRVVE